MKMQYTEEQIARANQTDLVSFLNEQGEQLVKSGREYRWKKHDSVTISGNRWYRHSQSKGGYPYDFPGAVMSQCISSDMTVTLYFLQSAPIFASSSFVQMIPHGL